MRVNDIKETHHGEVSFSEVCKCDSHHDAILNIAFALVNARAEEAEANKRTLDAAARRMNLESQLEHLIGIVAKRNNFTSGGTEGDAK